MLSEHIQHNWIIGLDSPFRKIISQKYKNCTLAKTGGDTERSIAPTGQ
jgi:hypothetical protein